MASQSAAVRFAPLTSWSLAPAALVVIGLLFASRALGVGEAAPVQTFTIIFTAIVVEAIPFVLLGALASALIEVYVSDEKLSRVTGLPPALQLPAATFCGFFFPVCECGSVPVARRLIRRGMHPSAGLAFMLASPVFNPIVLLSTWVAYSPRGLGLEMVAGRASLGFLVALVAGWALGTEGAQELLKQRKRPGPDEGEVHQHASGEDAACVAVHQDASASRKRAAFVTHVTTDFFFMGKFLIAGAALSAGFQTLLPQALVSGVARTAVVGTLALMAIAFLSSLCSEADAFVAVSFSQFPLGSQLAFLVFGPVFDLKLVFLYSATFHRRFVMSLGIVATALALAGSLLFELVVR